MPTTTASGCRGATRSRAGSSRTGSTTAPSRAAADAGETGGDMQRSEHRILTTHTGSLPRPPELTRLYVRRSRGEAIDPAELDRLGKAVLAQIIDKQKEAGVDVGS